MQRLLLCVNVDLREGMTDRVRVVGANQTHGFHAVIEEDQRRPERYPERAPQLTGRYCFAGARHVARIPFSTLTYACASALVLADLSGLDLNCLRGLLLRQRFTFVCALD